MKCPYCAETIQPDAQKCRHCGEWLKDNPAQASTDARAVAKGIKKQKQDEAEQKALVFVALLIGFTVGIVIGGDAGWIIGGLITIGGAIGAAIRYQKE